MTVALIIPPSPFLLDERVFVPLGILKVAAVLRDAGVPVEVLDLSGVENFEDAAADFARQSEASSFGLTATTPQMPQAARVAETIRRLRPDARLILGGPHATLTNAAVKKEKTPGRAMAAMGTLEALFDVIVCGDGERSILPAISDDAPKLIDADDPKDGSGLFMTNAVYEESPWPARELIDMESYHYRIEEAKATSVIAQLGCPFPVASAAAEAHQC